MIDHPSTRSPAERRTVDAFREAARAIHYHRPPRLPDEEGSPLARLEQAMHNERAIERLTDTELARLLVSYVWMPCTSGEPEAALVAEAVCRLDAAVMERFFDRVEHAMRETDEAD